MPRRARILLANTPHHVVQRGHNRCKVFAAPEDYEYYLRSLAQWKRTFDVKVFGWCLMTNHVHLLLKTGLTPIATVMRRLLTGYAVTFNRRHRRHGDVA